MVASRGGVDTAFHTAMARLTLALLGTPLVCGVAAHAVLAASGAKQRCGRMGMGRGKVDKRSSGLSMSLLQSSDTRDQNTRFAP
mmetsp:Transcript_25315/g.59728  ORF Transcript_25315/g.59728 Transcript_25315/m.59728 type:complete len:84 (-) Transcript_25315:330-581(-)